MNNIKISMTSMVDVCMCLLIVFLVSGSFILQPSLTIKVPDTVTNEENQETDKVIIYISKDGKFAVDDLIVKYSDIEQLALKKINIINSKMILIKADKKAKHGDLISIMAISKKIGASKITIETKIKE